MGFIDERRDGTLRGGDEDGLAGTDEECDRRQHDARQRANQEGDRGGDDDSRPSEIGGDQHAAPVVAIGDEACGYRQEHPGQQSGGRNGAEHEFARWFDRGQQWQGRGGHAGANGRQRVR